MFVSLRPTSLILIQPATTTGRTISPHKPARRDTKCGARSFHHRIERSSSLLQRIFALRSVPLSRSSEIGRPRVLDAARYTANAFNLFLTGQNSINQQPPAETRPTDCRNAFRPNPEPHQPAPPFLVSELRLPRPEPPQSHPPRSARTCQASAT